MPISVKDVSDMFGKDVFTGKGFYAGKISDMEFDLSRFKIRSLVIEAAKGSMLGKMVGGRKGIIVPYPMVNAIGDVVLIKHISSSALPGEEEAVAESAE
jgi:sporulation protein YlmC with PRC-barrel domain